MNQSSSIKTIYFFRHGETDWNQSGRFQGHSDIPLNKTGREQARMLRSFVEDLKPEVFLSSDLIRARQTAKIVNTNLRYPHLIDPRLREIHLGLAEGKTYDEVKNLWGTDFMEKWFDPHPDFYSFRFPGGESKLESITRIRTFLEIVVGELPYKNYAICGHGGTLKRFGQFISKIPGQELAIPNCCVYQFNLALESGEWTSQGQIY